MQKRILTGTTHPGEIELDEGLTSLGRNPTNDFRISDATVSSFHCELIVTDESVLVRDLNSTNGTFIDGEPVTEALLEAGQVLKLGHAELRLEVREVGAPVEISIPKLPVAEAPAENHLLDGSLACLNHPGTAAVFKCTKCEKAFCAGCTRVLKLQGGKTRLFCPSCSGPCERLPSATAEQKKQSLLGRLTQTIKIRFSK
jgi:pSer/pThr/pTyr-binding forkhead associated (FHA) protein